MSLTAHLKQPDSAVRRFLVERFSNTEPVVAEVEAALTGATTLRPDRRIRLPWPLIGHAIDYRLRGYFDRVSFHGIPERGAQALWGLEGFDFRDGVGSELDNQALKLGSVGRRLEREEEQWLARFCLVLSLFEVVYRSGHRRVEIASLSPETVTADQLLAVPEQTWVDDLCSLSWAFYENHAELLSNPAILNPTFAGSTDVGGADADLILDGCLLEIKATIHPLLDPEWLYQLFGYILLDYRDRFHINAVGIYFARQALLIQWPLDELMETLGGGDLPPLPELRKQFKQVVRGK